MRTSLRRGVGFPGWALVVVGCLIWGVAPTRSLPPVDPDGGPTFICQPEARVDALIRVDGLLLVDQEVTIDGSLAKITAVVPDPQIDCVFTLYPVGSFSWQLVGRPPGSAALLLGGATLTPTMNPDKAGSYTVLFSACALGCPVVLNDGSSLVAPPFTRLMTFEAVDEYAIPPETEPLVPDLPPTTPIPVDEIDGICQFGSDYISPAWITVEPWLGPQDYEMLEGEVVESRLAGKDNNFNHDSLDFLTFVDPDPPYDRLRPPHQGDVEVEWEHRAYPERFRPTRGDRFSARGYWIVDCPHGDKTEIHPPVMTASHRARAIRIPEAEGYGNQVYVPGIATDLYIGEDAGETTRNCSQTGLHQRSGFGGLNECLPQNPAPGISGYPANPIDALYTFRIYLPRDPQEIVSPIKPVPPVPLYRAVLDLSTDLGSGAPDPTFRVCPEECGGDPAEPTHLEVTLDLRGFTGTEYSRRIEVAWVYPSPDNWGLHEWKVRLHHIDVEDDGDWEPTNDGDWLLWFNTNNKDQEWTKVVDCDGCIQEEINDFADDPWETGDVVPQRRLGPNLKLFPDQKIWIHTSGFEDDWIWEDPVGRVTDLRDQVAGLFDTKTRMCQPTGPSDCLPYTLRYEIVDRGPVANANLTAAGQAIYEAYLITPGDLGGLPSLAGREQRAWRHPATEPAPEDDPLQLEERRFFKEQGIEPNTLHDATLAEFQELNAIAQDQYAAQLALAMSELREEIDEATGREHSDLSTGLAVLRESMPPELWNDHFADLPVAPDNCPSLFNPDQTDDDADGAGNPCDCAPQDPANAPHLLEAFDGRDENCNGLIDEVVPRSVFGPNTFEVDGPPQFNWTYQSGARSYELIRARQPDLAGECTRVETPDTFWADAEVPARGEVFYYEVRSISSSPGSWGAGPGGTERAVDCDVVEHEFTFRDRPDHDLFPFSLVEFFTSVPQRATDHILFEIRDMSPASDFSTAWCAERADWYVDRYLTHADSGQSVLSGNWQKWWRERPPFDADWNGPDTSGHDNLFGFTCFEGHSWCSEWGLGGFPARVIRPSSSNGFCEAFYFGNGGCGNSSWRLTIRIGPDRKRACGF